MPWRPSWPSHHYAWILVDGEPRAITEVRRTVHQRHPQLHLATRQEIETWDDRGQRQHFRGEAVAAAQLPAWPSAAFHDSVTPWTDEAGRDTFCTYQEVWFDDYHRAMKPRRTR